MPRHTKARSPSLDEQIRHTKARSQVLPSPSILSASKEALAIFTEWTAHNKLKQLHHENLALKAELALFGKSVGCVREECSACGYESEQCECQSWTCRCYECWLMRRVYKDAGKDAGGMLCSYRMVDDSANDAEFGARLQGDREGHGLHDDKDLARVMVNGLVKGLPGI